MTNYLHHGHRKRLLSQCKSIGFNNLTEVQQIELFLTYIIPRKDTNQTAHLILNKFKNFASFVDAEKKELLEIDGLSERAVSLIKLLPQFYFLYKRSRYNPKERIYHNRDELEDFLTKFLSMQTEEIVYAIGFNRKMKMLFCEEVAKGSEFAVEISNRKIAETVANYKTCEFLALAHNHPSDNSTPSTEDFKTTKSIIDMLALMDVQFIEHFVIGKDGMFRMLQSTYMKKLMGLIKE